MAVAAVGEIVAVPGDRVVVAAAVAAAGEVHFDGQGANVFQNFGSFAGDWNVRVDLSRRQMMHPDIVRRNDDDFHLLWMGCKSASIGPVEERDER